MPFVPNEFGQAKTLLGWNDVDPSYINWRNGVKAWVRTNACTGKQAAGIALWRRFKTFALTQAEFPGSV